MKKDTKSIRFNPSSPYLRPLLATLPLLAAFLLQQLLWSYITPYVWFRFYPAVFLSSWIGGLRFGILTTLLSTIMVWWYFIPPEHSFIKEQATNLFPATVFIFMGIIFSLFHER